MREMNEQHTYKAGDRVAIESGIGRSTYNITTVLRVTPTGRVVVKWGSGTNTYGKDGYPVGEYRYNRSRLMPLTPEIEQKIEHGHLAHTLDNVKWSELSIEKLRQIAELVK
jgi:hypothetical protein